MSGRYVGPEVVLASPWLELDGAAVPEAVRWLLRQGDVLAVTLTYGDGQGVQYIRGSD